MLRVNDIRKLLIDKYNKGSFVIDKTGVKLVEILGATFIADEDWIIRKPDYNYVNKEIEWYESQSLNVYDIPGKVPKIWQQVADRNGFVNSNYGWCIFSKENSEQYKNCIRELKKNPDSRRATMIYNRPTMHYDYNKDGMNDFICTYANQFFIRDNKLVSHYLMRSNDCVFGYCNDYAWAKHVQDKAYKDLKQTYSDLEKGCIIWTASSLHVYEKHFKFLDELSKQNLYQNNKK